MRSASARRVALSASALLTALTLLLSGGGCAKGGPRTRTDTPPEPLYEYRGAWVATANNLDWPSKRALSVAQQREEMRVMLNAAKAAKLNVIYLQVRAAGNRIYKKPITTPAEPWSRSVTPDGTLDGAMPADYDPLGEWAAACHARGI